MRRIRLLLLSVAVVAASCEQCSPHKQAFVAHDTSPVSLVPRRGSANAIPNCRFDWNIEERFGIDLNGDGRERALNPGDTFVAVVGDSYASGEGNPERNANARERMLAVWADSRDSAARHFSTFSAPALAAISLERSDPKTSVTF